MEYKGENTKIIDHGISLVEVDSLQEGINKAEDLLYKITGEKRNNILFLSGGRTPGPLYKKLSEKKRLGVAEYLMIDERYGPELHENSNQRTIVEAGLGDKGFHPILDDDVVGLAPTAEEYNRYFESLVKRKKEFGKWIAVLGIGPDGHTAGIAPSRSDFVNPILNSRSGLYVASFNDPVDMKHGGFGERVTLTFDALAQMDVLLILAFGLEKREALLKMLTDGSLEEIPARFYAKPEIAKKTILITDQKGLE